MNSSPLVARGLNITVPFKQEAYSYAARLTERARRAGAVNTLTMQDDGTVIGDTTDGVGMVRDIVKNLELADSRQARSGARRRRRGARYFRAVDG